MLKRISSFILNFILIVLSILLFFIILSSKTILNENYIIDVLEKNNFYERSYSDIYKDCESYTMQSGLDLEILEDLIPLEKVTTDINLKIKSIYENKEFDIETDSIRQNLDTKIDEILKNNNKILSDKEKESIEIYKDVMINFYKSGILYGKTIEIPQNIVQNIMPKYEKLLIVGIIFILVLLIIINRNINRVLNCLGISSLSFGIIIGSIKLLLEKRVQHILIMDQKFSNCLIDIINNIMKTCFKVGIIIGIMGILIIIITELINKSSKEKI